MDAIVWVSMCCCKFCITESWGTGNSSSDIYELRKTRDQNYGLRFRNLYLKIGWFFYRLRDTVNLWCRRRNVWPVWVVRNIVRIWLGLLKKNLWRLIKTTSNRWHALHKICITAMEFGTSRLSWEVSKMKFSLKIFIKNAKDKIIFKLKEHWAFLSSLATDTLFWKFFSLGLKYNTNERLWPWNTSAKRRSIKGTLQVSLLMYLY